MKPSALGRRLNLEQRVRLVADAQSMVEQYRAEMEAHYYPQRRLFERQANDDFRDRLTGDVNNPRRIFDLSNESINIVRNVTRFMIARTSEDIFGSAPIVAVSANGDTSEDLAEQMNRHGNWKLEQARWSKVGKEAIGLALNLGETIQKTVNKTVIDRYETSELVLVEKKSGKPVVVGLVDSDGAPQLNEDGEQQGEYIRPEDDILIDPKGRQWYAQAGIPVDDSTEFREVLVAEEKLAYHGPDTANLRFDAFIAPLNVASLDDADCLCHEYVQTVSQLRAKYGPGSGNEGVKDVDLEWLFQQIEQEPEGPKTAEDRPRETFGEVSQARAVAQKNPPCKVQEIWLHDYDAFEDGVGRNVFLVLVAEHDEPLYIEYSANVLPGTKLHHPFRPLPVNRVPGRWYGRGFYYLYRHSAEIIDALLNAILWKNEYNSDPLVAWQPDATEEGKTERRLIRRPGKTITLRPGKTAKDAVEIIEFPDCDERTWQLVQLIMQLIQTDSGVTSAAQGDYSALPSASTATGVSSILQSASTLHRMLTQDLKDGLEPSALLALEVTYAHQNRDETFRYLQGNAAEVLSLSSAKTLSQLELRVRLLLDRFQMREQREQATMLIKETLPIWVQMLQVSGLPTAGLAADTRPLFIQVAKGLDIHNADAVFALPGRPPPVPVGPDGQPLPVGPDGQPLPMLPGAPTNPGQPATNPALPPSNQSSAPTAAAPPASNQSAAAPPAPALPVNVLPAPTAGSGDIPVAGQPKPVEGQSPQSSDGQGGTPDNEKPGTAEDEELDEDSARQLLHEAGGDNHQARALAKERGKKVPA